MLWGSAAVSSACFKSLKGFNHLQGCCCHRGATSAVLLEHQGLRCTVLLPINPGAAVGRSQGLLFMFMSFEHPAAVCNLFLRLACLCLLLIVAYWTILAECSVCRHLTHTVLPVATVVYAQGVQADCWNCVGRASWLRRFTAGSVW